MEKENNRWKYTLSFSVIMLIVFIIPPLVYEPKPNVEPKKTENLINEESLRKLSRHYDSLIKNSESKRFEIMNQVNLK